MSGTVLMRCHCGDEYPARIADLKRGWGYSCGKSCAAKRRDFNLPKAKPVNGPKIKQTKNAPSSYRPNDMRRDHHEDIDASLWEPIQ